MSTSTATICPSPCTLGRTLVDGALALDLYQGQWVDYLYSVGNTVLSHERQEGRWVIRGFEASDGLVVRDTLGAFGDHERSA